MYICIYVWPNSIPLEKICFDGDRQGKEVGRVGGVYSWGGGGVGGLGGWVGVVYMYV